MTDKHTEKKGNVVVPAIAGAAIGATVAAGVVVLSDAKKRKKVIDTVTTVKDKTAKAIDQAKIKLHELQESSEIIQEDTQDVIDDMKSTKKKLV